jgi:hypothetical protein
LVRPDVLSVAGVAHAERLQVDGQEPSAEARIPAPQALSDQRSSSWRDEEAVPAEARPFLRLLSKKYDVAIRRVDALRNAGPHEDQDRELARRTALQEALHRLHELRERRNSVLDEYDLPARAGHQQD